MTAIIHQSAHVACSPERAYQYFTENELLEAFFTVKADVEPRVGGKYELDWDPPSRPEQSTVGCRVTALAENRILAFDWKGPPPYSEVMNIADPLTHVTLAFFPSGDGHGGQTEIHVLHSGWGEGERWEAARHYFDAAWRQVLDALAATVAKD
jgi:uncharacterized protein YndB with AHSA1/START domain